MIFVDTSIWIEYFRGKNKDLIQKLDTGLEEDVISISFPVWVELLSGASGSKMKALRKALSGIPCYLPETPCYEVIQEWLDISNAKGQQFGFADLLIASICFQHKASLWTLDSDFTRMEKLGFVKCLKD